MSFLGEKKIIKEKLTPDAYLFEVIHKLSKNESGTMGNKAFYNYHYLIFIYQFNIM
jgi:hypothetical protein